MKFLLHFAKHLNSFIFHPFQTTNWFVKDLKKDIFSNAGRIRQAERMRDLADNFLRTGNNVVADFICPTPELRKLFNPDFTIWVNTIESCRFSDTNDVFVSTESFDTKLFLILSFLISK